MSKLRICSAVNTTSVKMLMIFKRRKRLTFKSQYYFLFLNRELRRMIIIFCAKSNVKLIRNELSILFAKNRYIAIIDRNTFIFVIFLLMCACSRFFKQSKFEIYLWKNWIISIIFDEISIVLKEVLKSEMKKRKWRLEVVNFNDDLTLKKSFSTSFL